MPSSALLGTVTLEFDPGRLTVGDDSDLRQGLSGVVLDGGTLWLACDEGCRLERLSRTGATDSRFSDHHVFPLENLLTLPATPAEEADIEGLAVDDRWLWLVGSHSVKRKKPKKTDSPEAVADKLSKTSRDGNRHLLARVPLNGNLLQREHAGRHAASIAATPESSELLDAIRPDDPGGADIHLAPFVELPGKDNGLDIEGLAVRGRRAFVGLRGPVLREYCCILELLLDEVGGTLQLAPPAPGIPYRKHFLKLNGLGVRDLLVLGDDLLVLAGPTMAHDGPNEIWRWKNGAREGASAAATDVKPLLVLPQKAGNDRAEGLTVFEQSGGHTSVLVVFDTPAPERLTGESSVSADLYRLP